MNTESIISKLKKIYGPAEGIRVYMTIMPGILADFNKMLDKAAAYGYRNAGFILGRGYFSESNPESTEQRIPETVAVISPEEFDDLMISDFDFKL